MPGGDRTGPMGMGPMTGRAAGYCAGFGMPGFANRAVGGGFGRGWGGAGFGGGFGRGWGGAGLGRGGFGGGGRGWRHWFYSTGLPGWMRGGAYAPPYPAADPAAEREALERQAAALQAELDVINQRLAGRQTGAESSK